MSEDRNYQGVIELELNVLTTEVIELVKNIRSNGFVQNRGRPEKKINFSLNAF